MPKYAQIIPDTGVCLAVSYLTEEVEATNMILLSDDDDVNPRDTYDDGVWTPAPPQPTTEPQPSLEDQLLETQSQVSALNEQNTQLWELLITKGVI